MSAYESRPSCRPQGVASATDQEPFIFIDLGSRSDMMAAITKAFLGYKNAFAVTPANQSENLNFIWL